MSIVDALRRYEGISASHTNGSDGKAQVSLFDSGKVKLRVSEITEHFNAINDSFYLDHTVNGRMSPTGCWAKFPFVESSGTSSTNSADINKNMQISTTNVSWSTSGIIGNCLEFDEINVKNKAYVPNTSTIYDATDMTISVWCNPSKVQNSKYIMCHYDWWFSFAESKFRATIGRMNSLVGPFYYINSINDATTSTWYNLVMQYHPDPIGGNGSFSFYVNNELQSTVNITSDIIYIGYGGIKNLQLGNSDHSSTLPYEGLIDEVQIFSTILDSTSLTNVYNHRPASGEIGLAILSDRRTTTTTVTVTVNI